MLPLVFEQQYFRRDWETAFMMDASSISFEIIFLLNCAYLVRASLNSLYIPLSVLPVVEISAALE